MRQSTESLEGTNEADEAGAGLTAEERAAIKELVAERKAQRRRSGAGEVDGEREVLARIAEMPEPDRFMAERIHAVVKEVAPGLTPRTWYGMPAYAKDGKVICFFQAASKFKARYATFGFDGAAKLDDGPMWATSFALTELTPAVEERIRALLRKAVGPTGG